jgi:CheY-like chemotaxis protein
VALTETGDRRGILFVDDEPENVATAVMILQSALGVPVAMVETVEAAVARLVSEPWAVVVMDLFIPLGDHPQRVLGARASRYQEHVQHLGGLVLLEEIDRLPGNRRPLVVSHTACTDHVLLELFGDQVARRIPKPAPIDTLLHNLAEVLAGLETR